MGKNQDLLLTSLWATSPNNKDRTVAVQHAPILRFDQREPFLPLAAGYTVYRDNGESPSFRQGYRLDLSAHEAMLAIEYAIWWDWDINHLYELEHLWVYIDADERLVHVDGSWHGQVKNMALDGAVTKQDGHAVVYSEPGKHAFAPTPDWFRARRARFARSETEQLIGLSHILLAPFVRDQVSPTPWDRLLVRSYLETHAFAPTFAFEKRFQFKPEQLVPWPALEAWMPKRMNHWLAKLRRETPPERYRYWRIGHRGAAAHAPDNTLAGIEYAAELGADMVEVDLQCTADQRIVLSHDSVLRDAQGQLLPIASSTLEALKAVDLGKGEQIPTWEEAVRTCRSNQIAVYAEIKDGRVLPLLAKMLGQQRNTSHVIMASFRPDWLALVKAYAPDLQTSILFSATELDPVALARAIGASYVHPCWERFPRPSELLTDAWLTRVRKAGLGVICWHEERPDELIALCKRGVDGICSDAPELLLQAWELDLPPNAGITDLDLK